MNKRELSVLCGKDKDVRTYAKGEYLPEFPLIGVEVELENLKPVPVPPGEDTPVEDSQLPSPFNKYWKIVADGSLRNEGREFVLKHPLTGKDLEKALDSLENYLKDFNPESSRRTSVHVHVDMRGLNVEQLKTFLVYYLLFENVMFRFCGSHREDSIYCVPLVESRTDFPYIIEALRSLSNKEASGRDILVAQDILRSTSKYAALNLQPLTTFGSIEFRHHPGEWSASRLRAWCLAIMRLHEVASDATEDLYEPLQWVSSSGAEEVLTSVLGEDLLHLFMYPDIMPDMIEGARAAQDFIFAEDMSKGSNELLAELCASHPTKTENKPTKTENKKSSADEPWVINEAVGGPEVDWYPGAVHTFNV